MPTTAQIQTKNPIKYWEASTPKKRVFSIRLVYAKLVARKRFNSIRKALKEVDQFENGTKQPKSFDQFLAEF